MKVTRDPDDPWGAVREDDEAKLERVVLRRLHEEWRDVMDRLGDPPDIERLDGEFWTEEQNRLIAEIRPLLERMALHVVEGDAKAYTKAEPAIPASVPILWDEAVIFGEAADWARQYTYDLVRGIIDNTRESVRRGVAGFIETPGRTIGQLRDELAPLFGQSRAQRIAVTETTRAYAQGMDLVQREIRRGGIQMEQVWRTSGDERVCPICGPLNGKRKSEGWSGVTGPPPAHVNCRCWVTLDYTRGAQAEMVVQAPVRAEVPRFKTTKEAERWMKEQGLTKYTALGDMDVSIAQGVAESLSLHAQQFPETLGLVEAVGGKSLNRVVSRDWQATMQAHFDRLIAEGKQTEEGARRLMASIKAYGDLPGSGVYAQAYGKTAWFGLSRPRAIAFNPENVRDSVTATLNQNFGVTTGFFPQGTNGLRSYVDHEIGHLIEDKWGIAQQPSMRALWESVSANQIADGLSKYATTNIDEFIAEGWCEFLNNPSPRPLALKIANIMIAAMKGG